MTTDDVIHFSNLKRMALSPAHFKASVEASFEPTRAMRIGTTVHHLILGPHTRKPLVRFDGDARRGREWDRFASENVGKEIVTAPEWADAEPIAAAVLADPIAAELLRGTRREMPLTWADSGIECATDGIDFVGEGYIGDLKTTTCTEPAAFSRHAVKLLYHAQLAWVENGAKLCGIDTSKGLFLLGVEVEPPFAVTVLKLTEPVIDLGRKSCALWLERLRTCRENKHWPAYTQRIVDFELPPWMGVDDE